MRALCCEPGPPERRRDDREAGRYGEGGAAPLMKRVAIRTVPSLARPPRTEATAKTATADQEDLAPAEDVGGATTEQQQTAVAEYVAGDDPLQVTGGEDRGRRRSKAARRRPSRRRAVEEERAAEDEEGPPRRRRALTGTPPGAGGVMPGTIHACACFACAKCVKANIAVVWYDSTAVRPPGRRTQLVEHGARCSTVMPGPPARWRGCCRSPPARRQRVRGARAPRRMQTRSSTACRVSPTPSISARAHSRA